MAGNWGAILAGLAGGAGSLAQSMDAREKEAEAKKQRKFQTDAAIMELVDKFGLLPMQEGQAPKDALTSHAISQLSDLKGPGVQSSGGGSSLMPRIDGPNYTDQRDAQVGKPQVRRAPSVVALGDQSFIREPSQSRSAIEALIAQQQATAKAQAEATEKARGREHDFDLERFKVKNRVPQQGRFSTLTTNQGIYAFDQTTGKQGARLGDAPVKEMTPAQAAMQSSREQRQESSLRKDFDANALVKKAYGVAGAVADAQTALNQNDPVGDLMALYAMVKMFDPLSVVREGEIKLAQGANSLPEKVRLIYLNTTGGRKITPYYREQLRGLVGEMVATQRRTIAPVQRQFGASARRFGVDSASVARDPFEGVEVSPAPRAQPANPSSLESRKQVYRGKKPNG